MTGLKQRKLEQSSGADRRKWQRVEIDSRVRLLVHQAAGQSKLNGQLCDLSEGGISIFVPAELNLGDVIEAEIRLPYSSSPTRLKAVVRSRNSFRYGLEFVDITPPARRLLNRACSVAKLVDQL